MILVIQAQRDFQLSSKFKSLMSLAEASEARKARLQALKKRKTGEAVDDEE